MLKKRILIVLSMIMFGPSFIIDKWKVINRSLFKPTTGRWGVTVAESRQPYFIEWAQSFGPFIKNIHSLYQICEKK